MKNEKSKILIHPTPPQGGIHPTAAKPATAMGRAPATSTATWIPWQETNDSIALILEMAANLYHCTTTKLFYVRIENMHTDVIPAAKSNRLVLRYLPRVSK